MSLLLATICFRIPWMISLIVPRTAFPVADFLCLSLQLHQIRVKLEVKRDIVTVSPTDRNLANLSATLELLLSMW